MQSKSLVVFSTQAEAESAPACGLPELPGILSRALTALQEAGAVDEAALGRIEALGKAVGDYEGASKAAEGESREGLAQALLSAMAEVKEGLSSRKGGSSGN